MISTLHGMTTMHSNILSDIRIAGKEGFRGLEIYKQKLIRYIECGYKAKDLTKHFEKYSVKPVCINALVDIESIIPDKRKKVMEEAEILCRIAKDINCPTIQLVPLMELADRPWREICKITAENINSIASIGKCYDVGFQLECIAFSPICSISKSLEVIQESGSSNVGAVIDFWHLWAGGETTPDEVAKLDSSMIYGVHFCDGIMPNDEKWDEKLLRAYLPGEGDIPLKEWISAVKNTGFDGVWSTELISPKHWEWDNVEIAREMKKRMTELIVDTG